MASLSWDTHVCYKLSIWYVSLSPISYSKRKKWEKRLRVREKKKLQNYLLKYKHPSITEMSIQFWQKLNILACNNKAHYSIKETLSFPSSMCIKLSNLLAKKYKKNQCHFLDYSYFYIFFLFDSSVNNNNCWCKKK